MTLQRARERIAEMPDDGPPAKGWTNYLGRYAVLSILDEELADDLGAASERVEIRRNPDRSVDEVLFYVGERCVFHLEQMSPGSWYFGLYAEGEEPEQFGIYRDKRSVVVHPYTDPPRR